jgi:redox-sensitive bicupin YhaK (pirin superfamily)
MRSNSVAGAENRERRLAMLTIRKSEHRGRTQLDWLDSRHSFSFGEYHDPAHLCFGDLRVINEDVIRGGGGFPPHSHRDMEIVTYVLSGALRHRDSLGNDSVIRAGQIQRMSAGTGIVHEELNASPDEPVHLLQIWMSTSERGLRPSYEEKNVDPRAVANKFARIAAPEPLDTEIKLVQDTEIWAARFDTHEEAIHILAPGRRAWVQVVGGSVEIGAHVLGAGDALSINDEDRIAIRTRAPAEVLLFDLA